MLAKTHLLKRLAFREPRDLWEAVGMLAQIREQQLFAARAGDQAQVDRLHSLQAIVWAHIKTFATRLVDRGEAPGDMVDRLRATLQIHPARDQELHTARQRLAARPVLSFDEKRRAA